MPKGFRISPSLPDDAMLPEDKWKRQSITSLRIMDISSIVHNCPRILVMELIKLCFSVLKLSRYQTRFKTSKLWLRVHW
jgi:hypothetical protein